VVQGMQVKTVSDIPSAPYNLSRLGYQNLTTKNIWVHHTSQEAFYIGSDVPAPLIPISWTAYGLIVEHAGRDAYQYRNGRWVWMKNCTMSDIGEGLDDAHSHGFLYGTTTAGGYVENLTGSNIRGYGLQINGYGTLTFKNCNVSSGFNACYIKNYDNEDNYNQGGLVVNFVCNTNTFTCSAVAGYGLDARRDPAKPKITLNINSSTTFTGATSSRYVEDGVHGGVDNGIIYRTNSVCEKKGILY
jgi:hypothetical protein